MKILLGFIAAVVLLALAAAALIYNGTYNVAAVRGLHPWLGWALHTAMVQSVRRRAASITPPPNLAELAPGGAQDFAEMCVQCHGAPGKARGEIGRGLAPAPPSLKDAARRWAAAEIFWIVKNGVHMTGMPAFGPTHDDQRLWRIVAFVNSLPGMTPQQYDTVVAAKGNTGSSHHDHPDGHGETDDHPEGHGQSDQHHH